jgi:hypothetical protein
VNEVYIFLFEGAEIRATMGRFAGHGSAIEFLIGSLELKVRDVVPDHPRPGCQTYCLERGLFAVLYQPIQGGLRPMTQAWMDDLILVFEPPEGAGFAKVNGVDSSFDPGLAKWVRRYPDLTAKANRHANMWAYVPMAMMTLTRKERWRLWWDVGSLSGHETVEEVLGRWLLRHAPQPKR